MKKITFLRIILIICILILPVNTYATELENEIQNNTEEDNTTLDNTTTQEPTENKTIFPTDAEKQESSAQKTKSSNNYLQTLEITDMNIEPEFDPDIEKYYVLVDLSVEEIEVIATADDIYATVDIEGNTELKEGENIVTITVTAEDGSERIYIIYVTKTDDEEEASADLKTLKVEKYDLYPSFTSKIYKYNLTINENIKKLSIIAEAENPNAKVEISGHDNLEKGNNIITITVTAEDGITKREYQINTFISEYNVHVKEEDKTPAIIAIIVGTVIILSLGVYIISKKA